MKRAQHPYKLLVDTLSADPEQHVRHMRQDSGIVSSTIYNIAIKYCYYCERVPVSLL